MCRDYKCKKCYPLYMAPGYIKNIEYVEIMNVKNVTLYIWALECKENIECMERL